MKYCITIKGRVQGVFFRKYAFDMAQSLGIKGFVCNEPDGSVYCEAEGEENNIQQFLDFCGQGSPMSLVKEMEVKRMPKAGFSVFEILKS
jgi:acylphosphatase